MGKTDDIHLNKIGELENRARDFEEKWKRALADYQNLGKRTQEEKERLIKCAAEDLITKLFPVLDNLEKGAKHINDEGLNLAIRQFIKVLESEGVSRISTVGKVFNPQEMEAVDVVSGKEENKVRQEFRSGYKLHGKVIRVAQVQVEKKSIERKSEELAKSELQKGD